MTLRLQIRTRLTLAYTLVAMLLMTLLGCVLYVALRVQLNDAADWELTSRADSIARFLADNYTAGQAAQMLAELNEQAELNGPVDLVQLRDANGAILYRSKAGLGFELKSPADRPFTNQRVGRRMYRVLRRKLGGPQNYMLEVASDETEYHEALETLRGLLFLGIPIALLISFAAGLWMSGRVLRPIQTMAATVHAIDSRRLAVRLPLTGSGDELDRLSATLNGMLDRLQQSFERIGRFTADASHELRTPLALIRGNAEMMRRLPASAAGRAADIIDEADRMQSLIANLLELARSDQATPLNFQLLDPAELTARAEMVGRSLAGQRHLHFEVEQPRAIFPLFGDDTALSRVLVILLDNAVRHTADGGEVRLVVKSAAAECTLEVRDTGTGIDAKHLPHVFDRFYRVDEARNRAGGGTGLGLSIAHAIVTAHRGSIAVESAPGKGSTFRVTIPATPREG